MSFCDPIYKNSAIFSTRNHDLIIMASSQHIYSTMVGIHHIYLILVPEIWIQAICVQSSVIEGHHQVSDFLGDINFMTIFTRSFYLDNIGNDLTIKRRLNLEFATTRVQVIVLIVASNHHLLILRSTYSIYLLCHLYRFEGWLPTCSGRSHSASYIIMLWNLGKDA